MSAHLKTCGQNGEKAMCSLENTWTKEWKSCQCWESDAGDCWQTQALPEKTGESLEEEGDYLILLLTHTFPNLRPRQLILPFLRLANQASASVKSCFKDPFQEGTSW